MAGRKKSSAETVQEEQIPLEEAFTGLDTILEQLEDPEISLEDSFRKYQEGMQLLKYCNDRIDQVEKKVQKISDSGELEESVE
jgi:exodeoxyribonuclease VII small subunit